jgi:hypothetical protein
VMVLRPVAVRTVWQQLDAPLRVRADSMRAVGLAAVWTLRPVWQRLRPWTLNLSQLLKRRVLGFHVDSVLAAPFMSVNG